MFDLTHILYMIISGVITSGLLVLVAFFVKTEQSKDKIIKISAVITVILHFSSLWVDYLTTGSAEVENNQLFPIYPCNILMWLLLITAFIKRKNGVAFEMLSEFVFWGGIICGSIGIVFNINYGNNPNLLDYDILKGLVSHSTMVFGCSYLLVGGYIKIRMFNVISCALGLLLFLLDGLIINALFRCFGLESVNAMYLQESPIPSMPWLSPVLIGMVALTLLFVGLVCYETRLPREERWYIKLRAYKESLTKEIRGN